MFDIGAAELLVIVIIAILVIGPKDMPLAMRTAGRWIGRVRRVSAHFRTGIDAMVREAELEEMEKKWKAQNEEIMRRTSMNGGAETEQTVMHGPPALDDPADHGLDTSSASDPTADDTVPTARQADGAAISKTPED